MLKTLGVYSARLWSSAFTAREILFFLDRVRRVKHGKNVFRRPSDFIRLENERFPRYILHQLILYRPTWRIELTSSRGADVTRALNPTWTLGGFDDEAYANSATQAKRLFDWKHSADGRRRRFFSPPNTDDCGFMHFNYNLKHYRGNINFVRKKPPFIIQIFVKNMYFIDRWHVTFISTSLGIYN